MQQEIVNQEHESPTPVSLRMRIAETGIVQHRVAALLDVSDGHLSGVLRGTRNTTAEFLERIRDAIERVAAS